MLSPPGLLYAAVFSMVVVALQLVEQAGIMTLVDWTRSGKHLSVRHVLRAAHHLGMEVHVWTVNDARQMSWFIKRGVDNVITNNPDLAIRVRDEWANLTEAEQLLLAAHLLLGLGP